MPEGLLDHRPVAAPWNPAIRLLVFYAEDFSWRGRHSTGGSHEATLELQSPDSGACNRHPWPRPCDLTRTSAHGLRWVPWWVWRHAPGRVPSWLCPPRVREP